MSSTIEFPHPTESVDKNEKKIRFTWDKIEFEVLVIVCSTIEVLRLMSLVQVSVFLHF